MKKLTKILAIFLLITVVIVTAVACEKKDAQGRIMLKVPEVTVSGNTASWKPVKHAEEYGVVVDNEDEITTTSTTYTKVGTGNFSIKVRAIGDDVTTISSDYSEWTSTVAVVRRATPTGVTLKPQADNSVKASWDSVIGAADGYTVKLKYNNKTIASLVSTTNDYTITADQFDDAGAYQIEIITRGNGSDIFDSMASVAVPYVHKVTLANPTEVQLTSAGIIKFPKVDNATKYYIRMIDVATDKVVETIDKPTIGSNDVTLNLDNFTYRVAGKYYYDVMASREVISSYYEDSERVTVNKAESDNVRAELTILAAPTNFVMDADGKTLRWDAVEGAARYTVKMVSNTKTYTAETDKCEYDLETNSDMTSVSVGGKVVEIQVYANKDIENGFLVGNSTENTAKYNYVKQPAKGLNDVYRITSLPELMYIAKEPNANYILESDINVENGYIYGITEEFGGQFNGNNKTINNFNILQRGSETKLSLFGNVKEGAVIKNLSLLQNIIKIDFTNETVNGAALVAIDNYGTIENITATATINVLGQIGGLVINNYGTIKGCNVDIDITGYDVVGGVAANNEGVILNTFSYSSILVGQSVSANCYVGGIAGKSSGTITGSGVNGIKLKSTSQGDKAIAYAGGLAGYVSGGNITKCYTMNTGKIEASSTGTSISGATTYVGAFIGYADDVVIDYVYNTGGDLVATGYAGGFVAYLGDGAKISNGYSYISKIQGTNDAGLIYTNKGTVSNFYYAKFDLNNKPMSSGGNITGVESVTVRSEMKNLALKGKGFTFNNNVNTEFLIFSDVAYLGKDYNFNKGSIKYNEERTEFSKVYFGDKVIDQPTVKADHKNRGYRADIYTVEGFNITRVMQIS